MSVDVRTGELDKYSSSTLYQVIADVARKYPQKPAIEFMGRTIRYRQLIDRTNAAAASYENLGVTAGDRIAICLPNCPQLIISVFALSRLGAAAVLLNPLSSPRELAGQLEATGCKGLVISDLFFHKLTPQTIKCLEFVIYAGIMKEMNTTSKIAYSAAGSLKNLRALLFRMSLLSAGCGIADGGTAGCGNAGCGTTRLLSWKSFDGLSLTGRCGSNVSNVFQNSEADALIFFSGGTSGIPKPVRHSSRSLNLSAIQCLFTEPPIDEDSSILTVLPVFHIFGFVIALYLAIITGCLSILVPRFNAESTAKLIIKNKITYMAGVPTLYEAILESHAIKKAALKKKLDFSSFRIGFCGGDTLDEDILNRFNSLIWENHGTGRIVNGYGLTECCPVTVMPRDGTGPAGSLGKAFPGINICIVRTGTTTVVPPGEEGEICVNAASMMSCNTDLLQAHSDGREWLHTGDAGSIGGDGFLHFHHRLRRIIKVSGYTIFAGDVENVIMSCKCAEKVCVTGSERRIKAYVVLKPGFTEKKAAAEITSHCRKNLSPWAVPSAIEFRKSLPVNMLGKISWGQLEEDASK